MSQTLNLVQIRDQNQIDYNTAQHCDPPLFFYCFCFSPATSKHSSHKNGVFLLSGSCPLCLPIHPLSMADVSPLSLSRSIRNV